MKTERRTWQTLGLAIALLGAGCAARGVSPQLSAARLIMESARSGSAQQFEPDQVLVARRNLELAEAQADGSRLEAHYAYLSERETRAAIANSHRAIIEGVSTREEAAFHDQLAGVARDRRVALAETNADLAARDATLARRDQDLRASEEDLERERSARISADASAAIAIDRLRAVSDVRIAPTETVITLSGEVLFETNRAVLRPEARERLGAVADALRASPRHFAIVAGYTDSRGSDSRNEALSQTRAQAVADFLLEAGVSADRMRAEGRGEASPVASNDSPEGRANNRRVEIILRPIAVPETVTETALPSSEGPRGHDPRPTP